MPALCNIGCCFFSFSFFLIVLLRLQYWHPLNSSCTQAQFFLFTRNSSSFRLRSSIPEPALCNIGCLFVCFFSLFLSDRTTSITVLLPFSSSCTQDRFVLFTESPLLPFHRVVCFQTAKFNSDAGVVQFSPIQSQSWRSRFHVRFRATAHC